MVNLKTLRTLSAFVNDRKRYEWQHDDTIMLWEYVYDDESLWLIEELNDGLFTITVYNESLGFFWTAEEAVREGERFMTTKLIRP